MRSRFSTADPDQALEWIRQHYTHRNVTMSPSGARFRFEHRKLDGGSFALGQINHSAALRIDLDPAEHLLATYLQDGRYEFASGDDVVQPLPGETFLCPRDAAGRVRWENVEVGLVRLDRLAAAAKVGGKGADLIPLSTEPISPLRARSWNALVRYISREMLPSGAMNAPLVRSAAFGLLAVTFAQTFPCRIPALSRRYAVSDPPDVVRRAVEFIESHAHEPIAIDDIAEAARIGPRGLQVAFRRHLDATPTEYLRRVRLDLAHRHLAAADPESSTVKRIAARWGFANVSRFSRAYAERYGCSPLVTLHS